MDGLIDVKTISRFHVIELNFPVFNLSNAMKCSNAMK